MKRFLPLSVLFLCICITFILLFSPMEAIREDLGRHLLLGKIIVTTHSVPKVNLLSYTNPTFPFINTHWLSEVVYYVIYAIGGLDLLHFVSAAVGTLAISLILIFAYRQTNIYAVGLGFFLYVGIMTERIYLRPEIFSYLFFSIFLLLLYKNRKKHTKWIFILPLFELLWVNMHIYFILGPLLVGLFWLDGLFTKDLWHTLKTFSLSKSYKDHLVHNSFPLSVVILLTFLATLINPNGLSEALYPFHVFDNYGYTIIENQTIFWLAHYNIFRPSYAFTEVTIALLLLISLLTLKKRHVIDWLLVVVFSVLAIQAIRNFELFVLGTFLIFCTTLHDMQEFLKDHWSWQKTFQKWYITYLFLAAVAIIMIAELFYFLPLTGGFSPALPIYGDGAANFFLDHHLKGPIFNNFDIGGYLAYRFYPQEKVFVDNRPEAYPASFFTKVYIPMQYNPTLFQKYAQKYHVNTIIFAYLDHTDWGKTFLSHIANDPTWTIVYLDDYAVILVRNTWENRDVIQQFGMSRGNVRVDRLDANSKDSIEFLGQFFDVVNWGEYETTMMQKLLRLDPHSCEALYTLPKLYTNAKNPTLADFYTKQYQQFCQ